MQRVPDRIRPEVQLIQNTDPPAVSPRRSGGGQGSQARDTELAAVRAGTAAGGDEEPGGQNTLK